MSVHDIELRLEGPVAHLVLNRPEKRNALTLAMWDAIPGLLADAKAHKAARVLVLRGAGGVFAAGADIAEFETTYGSREAALANHQRIQAAMSAMEDFPLPTIAAIEGACVGGGCGLALSCDLRLADPRARFGITPGKLGLAYGVADTRRLVQAVGLSKAKDILFTGRLLDSAEALRIGLIDRLAEPDQVNAALQALIDELLAASRFSAQATKTILRMLRDGETQDTAESRALFAASFEGEDFKEGFAAFMEKRKPNFS